jgi:hypothetical protein
MKIVDKNQKIQVYILENGRIQKREMKIKDITKYVYYIDKE